MFSCGAFVEKYRSQLVSAGEASIRDVLGEAQLMCLVALLSHDPVIEGPLTGLKNAQTIKLVLSYTQKQDGFDYFFSHFLNSCSNFLWSVITFEWSNLLQSYAHHWKAECSSFPKMYVTSLYL